ncbi:alpha/beta fold hydrolase [Winkia neuii]|uniref:alpha/beta fold hydrolase n=1 Tax=Winkia neuii TaxID=33007 RepID=UPI0023A98C11|nr:alpha/beta hydrolase [Winkia neuii]WEB56522.1 alpha/beta hydrolase [Winkia neuii]
MTDFRPLPTEVPDEAPPQGKWGPDISGPGFEAQTLSLHADSEGPVMATLVAHRAEADPQAIAGTPKEPGFVALYIHGWNDYFFQREQARHVAAAGGAFYAIDLRKYGRSWRLYQSFGYVDSLDTYDEDLDAALRLIRSEHPHLPLLLMGHSTGGLSAALWANRHRDQVSALLLNSPWITWQYDNTSKTVVTPLVRAWSWRAPRQVVPMPEGENIYARSLAGWDSEDGPLPDYLRPWREDPSVRGWNLIPQWKTSKSAPIRPGWLQAILAGHTEIAKGLQLTCPTLVWASVGSFGGKWNLLARRRDAVLDADKVAATAHKLSTNVTLRRFESLHDVILSDPDVRQSAWASFHAWLPMALPQAANPPSILGEAACTQICP